MLICRTFLEQKPNTSLVRHHMHLIGYGICCESPLAFHVVLNLSLNQDCIWRTACCGAFVWIKTCCIQRHPSRRMQAQTRDPHCYINPSMAMTLTHKEESGCIHSTKESLLRLFWNMFTSAAVTHSYTNWTYKRTEFRMLWSLLKTMDETRPSLNYPPIEE